MYTFLQLIMPTDNLSGPIKTIRFDSPLRGPCKTERIIHFLTISNSISKLFFTCSVRASVSVPPISSVIKDDIENMMRYNTNNTNYRHINSLGMQLKAPGNIREFRAVALSFHPFFLPSSILFHHRQTTFTTSLCFNPDSINSKYNESLEEMESVSPTPA